MTFRANESAISGFEEVKHYYLRNIESSEVEKSKNKLYDIMEKYGSVIESYPSWHPLVNRDDYDPVTSPSVECGYLGLDHTRYFANAFITCPYVDGKEVLDSVNALPANPFVEITAECLDVQLYASDAVPILVRCDWNASSMLVACSNDRLKLIDSSGIIPAEIAIPLMLQKEVPCWERAKLGETWETMRPYFLGNPHGSTSSLFVNQKTGLTMKKIWKLLINTGMFGPIKVSNQY